jgi:hypothetical protein
MTCSRIEVRPRAGALGTEIAGVDRSVQHLALNGHPGHRRLMHRVQIKGTRPV